MIKFKYRHLNRYLDTYYFYFCDNPKSNIQITMLQQQTQQLVNHQQHQQPALIEEKVNPEVLIANIDNQPTDKYTNIEQQSVKLNDSDIKTPKKERSQQKSSNSNEKLTQKKHSQSLKYSTKNVNNTHFKNSEKIPEEQQEAEHKNYEDLTMKLQLVLNKIASSTKVINKSANQSQNMIVRFEQCQQRKKKLIDKKKEQYEQQKAKQLKQKPTIDKNSDKISKQIGHKPIHLRVEAMVEQKKKKLQRNEELRKKRLEEQEELYIEQYNKHVKKPDNVRSYDEYFSEMVRWKEKRVEQNKQKQEMKKSKELEGITFQPILNSKSKKMVSSQTRLPIEQRGLIKTKKPSNSSSYIKI